MNNLVKMDESQSHGHYRGSGLGSNRYRTQKKDTGTMSEELTGHPSAYYSTTALHPEDRDLCCGLSETKLSSSRNDRWVVIMKWLAFSFLFLPPVWPCDSLSFFKLFIYFFTPRLLSDLFLLINQFNWIYCARTSLQRLVLSWRTN